jgi:polar amino acid transport system substrate-binding protein
LGKRWFPALAALGLMLAAGSTIARAGVIDEVRRSGLLVAGTRADSPPFGFADRDGHIVGFSVDLLNDLTTALSAYLERPVRLELKPVTPENRTEMIRTGTIQIECGITTATWERRLKAEFSIPFFANGTRILTRRRFGQGIEELAGKRIGVVAGSTTRREVETAVPKAVIVEVSDMSQGMKLFRDGKIDGLSNIGIVLRGLLEQSEDKADLVLLPRAGAIQYEPLACMLPRDDSAWQEFVDRLIAKELEGAPDYNGRYVELYNTWFGPGSALPMPLDHTVIDRLVHAAYWIE